jgi:hypothetical protein
VSPVPGTWRPEALTESTEDGFDQVIHTPMRLRICAALDPVRDIEFGTMVSLLGISKPHSASTSRCSWTRARVEQRRTVRDTRQRVRLHLTETERGAYRGYVAALHRIVGQDR